MRSSSRGGGNYVRTPVKVFSLGSPSAESDDLVTTAYFNNGDLSLARDFGDFHRFLVGRTGSGKTALFEELNHLEGKRVIRFSSKTLSLPYVLDLPAIQELVGMEVHLEPFFDALWKHVIVVEVIRHRYKVTSPEGQDSLIENLLSRLHGDPGKRVALAYVEWSSGISSLTSPRAISAKAASSTSRVGSRTVSGRPRMAPVDGPSRSSPPGVVGGGCDRRDAENSARPCAQVRLRRCILVAPPTRRLTGPGMTGRSCTFVPWRLPA